MNSPRKVPARRPSNQMQLLDELEVLSQALYQSQAQQKTFLEHPGEAQNAVFEKDSFPAFARKPITRVETLPARRFSSYEPSKDPSAVPLPGLVPSINTGTHTHPVQQGSRHSISAPRIPTTADSKPSPVLAGRPRFTSTSLPSQSVTSWGDDKLDIRGRIERRGSPQLQPSRNSGQFTMEEYDWPDENPTDVSGKVEPYQGDKKKSFWNWKPFRAISHIGRQKYYCVFSAYIHAVKGLPLAMNGLRLAIQIRKEETKDGTVQTMPSRVFQGVAEFEETLYMKCTVYGSKGSHSNSVKFMSKAFIVSVVAPDVEELDLGKHLLDLSRLLPESVDERKGDLERGSSWNTSLELSGKAKGGKLVITFNCEVLDKDLAKSSGLASKFQGGSVRRRSSMQHSYSLPNSAHGTPVTRTADPYGNVSPSVSEPGNDFNGALGMEALDLDDPLDGAGEVKSHLQPEVQYYPSMDTHIHRATPASLDNHNAFDQFEPRLNHSSEELTPSIPELTGLEKENAELDDYLSDNEQEFTVVDQGMEIEDSVNFLRTKEEEDKSQSKHSQKAPDNVKEFKNENSQLEPIQQEPNQKETLLEEGTPSSSARVAEKKETVTYQMVMLTLESLLQGTSAKEKAHSDLLEAKENIDVPKNYHGSIIEEVREATVQSGSKQQGLSDVKSPELGIMEVKQKDTEENLDQEVDQFLNMLEFGEHLSGQESDNEADSPRAQLLKKFEKEALLDGTFDLDIGPSKQLETIFEDTPDSSTLSSGVSEQNRASAFRKSISGVTAPRVSIATQSFQSQSKDWKENVSGEVDQDRGWKEKTLHINTPKELEPEPLGKSVGNCITVKDGGTLRSMNPVLFQSENCSGKLVMQVSKPVVLPAEMGSGTVDILRNMASMGIENMAIQTMTAMHLEELMGTPIEQIAMEGLSASKVSRIRSAFGTFKLRSTVKDANKSNQKLTNENRNAFVSLENLAPTAMQQIEFLAMEGLKIQTGMSEDEAPYALNAFSMEAQNVGNGSSGGESAATFRGITGVHLLKGARVPAQTAGGAKGLMDMAITLDEWMLLDEGAYNEAEGSKDALAIMAAHRAVKHKETRAPTGNRGPGAGCMGNMLTLAMLVQLRDPSRSLEPIGVPMIAFVQAERVVMPDLSRSGAVRQSETLFDITGIHLSGIKASQDNRRVAWGSQRQARAATRWILANGMSKPRGAASLSRSKLRQGECLWSISAQLLGTGNKWKELRKSNPHVRNPDILYESHIAAMK
ncbi:hypothetical protein KP509_35G017200 [Ceratopteris richardii]|uniref:C2 NT-type domain-containing protein n=1 Tax=Ceratopteris richardii TaxID=49495 RepID=A0A8T2QDQ1_CERRI|nr:hypothetical protein KP509_35G017200 [Ceratopteris richardii]